MDVPILTSMKKKKKNLFFLLLFWTFVWFFFIFLASQTGFQDKWTLKKKCVFNSFCFKRSLLLCWSPIQDFSSCKNIPDYKYSKIVFSFFNLSLCLFGRFFYIPSAPYTSTQVKHSFKLYFQFLLFWAWLVTLLESRAGLF